MGGKTGEKGEIGSLGEGIACEYLVNRGFLILARNHRERFDEIDIIAKSPLGMIIFLEVKTMKKQDNQIFQVLKPEDNLSAEKYRKVSRACELFVGKHPDLIGEDVGWRIDLLAVSLDLGRRIAEVRHYKNI